MSNVRKLTDKQEREVFLAVVDNKIKRNSPEMEELFRKYNCNIGMVDLAFVRNVSDKEFDMFYLPKYGLTRQQLSKRFRMSIERRHCGGKPTLTAEEFAIWTKKRNNRRRQLYASKRLAIMKQQSIAA